MNETYPTQAKHPNQEYLKRLNHTISLIDCIKNENINKESIVNECDVAMDIMKSIRLRLSVIAMEPIDANEAFHLAKGLKISAIKLYRSRFPEVGLLESRLLMDAYEKDFKAIKS